MFKQLQYHTHTQGVVVSLLNDITSIVVVNILVVEAQSEFTGRSGFGEQAHIFFACVRLLMLFGIHFWLLCFSELYIYYLKVAKTIL